MITRGTQPQVQSVASAFGYITEKASNSTCVDGDTPFDLTEQKFDPVSLTNKKKCIAFLK